MKRIPVREFMQREPVSAHPEMPLPELVTLLRDGGYRALPVTDADGKVVGVISETDLFLKEHALPFSTQKVPSLLGEMIGKDQINQVAGCREMTVDEVMHPSAVTIGEDITLEDLSLLMCERHLSMVPVVRDDLLVGVVRRGDILAILYGEAA